jgi:5-methylcytosine-specific restriction endonuclease McrA
MIKPTLRGKSGRYNTTPPPVHNQILPLNRFAGFYGSDDWLRVRYGALVRAGGYCECCGEGPKPGKPLHVDHVKPRSKYPELELEPTNLQVLCPDCNMGKGAHDETDWRKL